MSFLLVQQEGQHPLTGQRAPTISGGTYSRHQTRLMFNNGAGWWQH